MFAHTQEAFGKFVLHKIYNEATQTGFSIVPAYGGIVLDIQFGGTSIIDGYKTPIELDIADWGKSILMYPFPNRLRDGIYQWGGETYEFPINDSFTENAIHGLGKTEPMNIHQVQTSETAGELSCQFHYQGQYKYYPFPFVFTASFKITADTLEVELAMENKAEVSIPVGFGWHPYFALSADIRDSEIQLPPLDMVGIDERMIPTGKRYSFDEFLEKKKIGAAVLDNCFAVKTEPGQDKMQIQLSGEKGTIDYWQELGTNKYQYVQLFMPPMRASIAIEPMTCNVNAFNNGDGLIHLEVGEQVAAKFGLTYTKP
ncbi:MAG: aldose 1-epimerase [Bacteroidota bacterium]